VSAFRFSDSQLEPRFILELQEHVKHVKCYLTHGLEGLDVEFFLPQEQSAQVGQRSRRRPDASSEQTGTMGQLYHSAAFFSYSIIMYSKPKFAVSLAPCTTCGSRAASKKKCGFMVCCRERPAWWGALVKI